MRSALRTFYRRLTAYSGEHVFNPWRDVDTGTDVHAQAARQRLQRLRRHLAIDAALILVGEAPGYQGCHVTGIPFTSERLILAGGIPRIAVPTARLSVRARPWSEPSATTMWGILGQLGVAEHAILWNAFPWHPHRPGNLQSNRTPTPAERSDGLHVLALLLRRHPQALLFAVGRHAEASLAELGRTHRYLRHPSMGGAAAFRRSLRAALHTGRGALAPLAAATSPARTPVADAGDG